jgi:tetratricopeptide (TPR) repeat protein
MLLAHLLSGRKVDDTGSVVNLDRTEFKRAWEFLAARHPECFVSSQDRVAAWHRRNADEFQEAGEWSLALVHLDPLLEADPGNWELHAIRGETREGKMQEAAAAYGRAIELGTFDMDLWQKGAFVALAAGELESYRSICRRFVERFADTENLWRLNYVAWTCALGPRSIEDLVGLAGRLERLLGSGPKDHEALNTVGALFYRAGDLPRAVRILEESRGIDPRGGSADDWLFLAMAYHGQGRGEEAAAALAKGLAIAQARLDPPAVDPGSGLPYYPWFNRLSAELLRNEAQELVR